MKRAEPPTRRCRRAPTAEPGRHGEARARWAPRHPGTMQHGHGNRRSWTKSSEQDAGRLTASAPTSRVHGRRDRRDFATRTVASADPCPCLTRWARAWRSYNCSGRRGAESNHPSWANRIRAREWSANLRRAMWGSACVNQEAAAAARQVEQTGRSLRAPPRATLTHATHTPLPPLMFPLRHRA